MLNIKTVLIKIINTLLSIVKYIYNFIINSIINIFKFIIFSFQILLYLIIAIFKTIIIYIHHGTIIYYHSRIIKLYKLYWLITSTDNVNLKKIQGRGVLIKI